MNVDSPWPVSAGRGHPKVVAHFLDGQILKGFALDFRPSRRSFFMKLRGVVGGESPIRIRLADLKAVFFVREFDGNSAYRELSDVIRPSLLESQVRVRFRDGEVLRGTSPRHDAASEGFFVIPMDPRSNNRRIFVMVNNAVESRFEPKTG